MTSGMVRGCHEPGHKASRRSMRGKEPEDHGEGRVAVIMHLVTTKTIIKTLSPVAPSNPMSPGNQETLESEVWGTGSFLNKP